MASDILVIDDEKDIRELVAGILEDEGHGTRMAGDSDSALAAIGERKPSMIFLDIWLQGSKLDGLELLEVIKKTHADLPVVVISGHGNIDTAVAAIRKGAADFIEIEESVPVAPEASRRADVHFGELLQSLRSTQSIGGATGLGGVPVAAHVS